MTACLLLASSHAAADGLPIVHGVPSVPLTGLRLLAHTPGGHDAGINLDASPPASAQFYLEIPVPDASMTGVLKVWPLAEQDGDAQKCGRNKPEGKPQSYTLGMGTVKEDEAFYLRATVPPLQVDQKFCFAVTIRFTISTTEMNGVAAMVANQILTDVSTPPTPCDLATGKLEQLLRAQLDLASIPVDDLTIAVAHAKSSYDARARAKCGDMQAAHDRYTSDRKQLPRLQAALDRKADTSGLPVLTALAAPRLTVQGVLTDAATIAKATAAAETIDSAASQLRVRLNDPAYPPGDRAILAKWADALDALSQALARGADDPDRKAAVEKALSDVADLRKPANRLSAAEVLKDASRGTYTSAAALVGTTAGTLLSADDVLADLEWIGAHEKPPTPDVVQKWMLAFASIKRARDGVTSATADTEKAKTDYNTALQVFQTALTTDVLLADDVRSALVVSVKPDQLAGVAGEGVTPAAANYASVDAGVFLARPAGGPTTTTWLIPYLGLNLYSTPVDRTIGVWRQTGGRLQRLRQKVSLTIGVTLTQPSITGRTLSAPLAGHYPILAVGIRLTQFTRITAGAAFYDIADANPASAGHKLAAAPFVGAALDIDVVHLLTQALKGGL